MRHKEVSSIFVLFIYLIHWGLRIWRSHSKRPDWCQTRCYCCRIPGRCDGSTEQGDCPLKRIDRTKGAFDEVIFLSDQWIVVVNVNWSGMETRNDDNGIVSDIDNDEENGDSGGMMKWKKYCIDGGVPPSCVLSLVMYLSRPCVCHYCFTRGIADRLASVVRCLFHRPLSLLFIVSV